MNPSISKIMCCSRASSIAPTIMAISSPPKVANVSSGVLGSYFSETSFRICILWVSCSPCIPVPDPVQSSIGTFRKRCISSDEGEVLPIPISPKPMMLQSCSASCFTSLRPFLIAVAHSSAVMAGSRRILRVPRATLAFTTGTPSGKSKSTPASTTFSLIPFWRQNTLMAAPPATKFITICQVTSFGNGLMPSSVRP